MLYTFYKDFIILLVLLDARLAISLGFYKEMLKFLERVGGDIFCVFAGVKNNEDFLLLQLTFQNAPKLILVTQAPFGPSGRLFAASCSWLIWGGFFIVLAGVQIMTIFSMSLSSRVLQN